MKRISVFLVVILIVFSKGIAQDKYKEADTLIEDLVSKNKVIGVSAAFAENGEIKWQHATGYAEKRSRVNYDLTTKIRIASITKPMTAVAAMQLVEDGLLQLDEPVQTYIPDYPENSFGTITVKHLLSHTSGIGGYKNGKGAQTTKEYASLEEATKIFRDRECLFEPGTQYAYTTYGYVVLGLLIEKVSGLTYEEYMHKNILNKCGMSNTGIEKFRKQRAGESTLYHRSKNGKIKEAKENNLSNRIPGGGFYSDILDMVKFGNAILNNTLIKESTLKLMTTDIGIKKEGNPYGLGWFIYAQNNNEAGVIGGGGEQTGVSGQLMIMPRSNGVVIVLSNTSGSLDEVRLVSGELINLLENRN